MRKRLLSLILAICMLAGMMPAVSAEQEPLTIKYDLSGDMFELGMTYPAGQAIKNGTATGPALSELTYENTGGFYELKRAYKDVPDSNWVCYYGNVTTGENCNIGLRQNCYVTFEVYIPASGTYKMKAIFGTDSSGGKNDYVGTMNVFAREGAYTNGYEISNNDYFGSYSCIGDADKNCTVLGEGMVMQTESDNFTLKSDEAVLEVAAPGFYVISFKTAYNTANKYRASVAGFELISESATGKVPMGMRLNDLSEGVASVTGIMSDKSEGSLGNVSVTYESLNPEIATVDAVTGKITDISEGVATIKATAILSGREVTATGTYKSADIVYSGITVKYNIGETFFKLNEVDKVMDTSDGVFKLTYGESNGFFALKKASNTGTSTSKNMVNIRIDEKNRTGGVRLRGDDRYIAYEVYVPTAGFYNMNIKHASNTVGTDTEVYLSESEVWTDSDFGEKVGSYSVYDENTLYNKDYFSTIKNTPSTVKNINIKEPGYYVFTFKAVGTASVFGFVGSFELNGGEGKVLMGMKLDEFSDDMAKAIGVMSDGSETELRDVDVTYKSLDTSIATVDADTGVINAVGEGNVTITATANIAGREVVAEGTYTAIKIDGALKLRYDIGAGLYELNLDKTIEATANGQMGLTYDLSNGFYNYSGASIETSNSFINCRIDKVNKSGNIRVRSSGAWIAFEVNIPSAGIYDMNMWHGRNDSGTDTNVYVSSAERWSTTNFGTYAGTYSSYDKDTIYNKDYFNTVKSTPSVVEDIKIKTPGKYVFTFQVSLPADGNTWLYGTVGTFELIAGDELALMGVKLKTERNLAKLYAHMSDNTLSPFAEDVEITYSSADENIAEIDSLTGVITDKAYGKVEITGSCEVDGKTYTSKVIYTALDPNARGVYINVNLGDALDDTGIRKKLETKFNVINYDYSNGIYRFYQASTDAHKSGAVQVGPKNIAVRHGYQLALEVLIPEPGIYTMEMWPAINDEIVPINVYMAKGKVSSEDTDKIGSYDSKDMSVAYNPGYFNNISKTPYFIENIVVEEAGYYVFNFVGDASMYAGETNYNYRRGSVGNFSLYSGTDKSLMGGFYSENEDEVKYMIAYPDENEVVYTDPVAKGMTMFNIPVMKLDGTVVETEFDSLELISSDETIATVGDGGIINTIGDGAFEIDAKVALNGKTYKGTVPMSAYDDTGVATSELVLPSDVYVRETLDTTLVAIMASGNRAAVPTSVKIDYSYEPEGVVKIDENGKIAGLAPGTATVTASAFYKGAEVKASADIICVLHEGKTEPTYYTYAKRDIALDNISKYSWAKSTKNSAVSSAEKYLENYEFLYNHIPHEGIPRSTYASNAADPDYKYCRYCGEDVAGASMGGVGGWGVNPIVRPWKIQCSSCKRVFPSNDFALLYSRGLDENGHYDADLARENNAIAVANGEKDALLNTLYPEIEKVTTINNGKGLRPGETVEGWGVDDGWGYRPKMENGTNYKLATGDVEIHAYIPYYMTSLWGTYDSAITSLANAYLYTGDMKYGRAGAILFDRYADLIHEYDTQIQQKKDGDKLSITASGFIKNGLSDAMNFGPVVKATDALYPAISDPQVISFLSRKAQELGLENDKSSEERIWENWKQFYLKLFEGAQNGRLNSNFGVTQGLIAACAVVLDEEPETTEMLKWIYAPGEQNAAKVLGGNVLAQLIDDVDRDGMGNESADNYNVIWFGNLWGIADMLKDYEGEAQMNLLEYPKFSKMFAPYASKVLVSTQLAQVGDSSGVARLTFNGTTESFLNAFKELKDNPDTEHIAKTIAQYIYIREGYTLENLKYGIFVENPENVQNELMEYIDTTPDQVSEMIAGYGFAILRDGADWRSASAQTAINNQRDVWMYFGAASSHSHNDNMNIGIEAFGLNLSPDNGYPERTGKDPNRAQWHTATISHNTVLINEKDSTKDTEANGVPMHFDDDGNVKLMDVDGRCSYEEAENYRRTLVMMKVNDDVSYTVDFFRVTGGDKHTFSFHAQAENALPVEGIELTEQKDENGNWTGTYAYGPDKDGNIVEGVNVPYQVSKKWEDENGNPYLFNEAGQDPHTQDAWAYETYFPRGYTWLTKIRRDKTPEQNFAIEFDVEDYRKAVKDNGDIRLRMTQLNSFTPSEVAIAAGLLPRKDENKAFPETFDYVLVHNSKKDGEDKLDSLYATVFEPYVDNRYIESIEAANVDGVDNTDPTVRAIKVTHIGGKRTDYIVYSADNTKALRIDNLFDFKGFIGVYSINDAGEVIYKYVNDGEYIGDLQTERDAYEGVITDFDGEMNFGDFKNHIDISIDGESVTDELLRDLADKWMFIENDGKENAAYKILSAERLSDGTIRLNTGDVTNIRSYVDAYNPDLGYVYNMGIGDKFRIPVSKSDDASPVFNPVNNITTNAGGAVKIMIQAESPLDGKTITYSEGAFPRGMTIDSESGEITWNPSSSQVGENHISVTAKDSDGREATLHFTVTVYGSTSGGASTPTTPSEPTTPTTPSEPTIPSTPSGGGSGGGGGGAAPTTPVTPTTPTEPEKPVGEDVSVIPPAEEEERFVDLGAYAWAEDAINALADAGIIKGTSENTFSPANNITRADFTILLVRAFELKSDDTTNFADVSDSDYFAKELAIARNTGIVNGIGDNKYAPRNQITRQDMMTIVYRAMTAMEKSVGAIHESPEMPDFDTVSDYAREAVSALVGAGLVNGKNGLIAPTDYTTRAEVAVLIKRILDM